LLAIFQNQSIFGDGEDLAVSKVKKKNLRRRGGGGCHVECLLQKKKVTKSAFTCGTREFCNLLSYSYLVQAVLPTSSIRHKDKRNGK
jgi:hypothetical protein